MAVTAERTSPAYCDLCEAYSQQKVLAQYDAFIPPHRTWGFLCNPCFVETGASLGTGKGQKLIYVKETN